MLPKFTSDQHKKLGNEMDKEIAANSITAKKEPSEKDIETQSKKISKKTKNCIGTIIAILAGIITICLVAYFSYHDGLEHGFFDAKDYFVNDLYKVRVKIEVFTDENGIFDSKYLRIAPSKSNTDDQSDVLLDIMTIVAKYVEECKKPTRGFFGDFYITNSCFRKLGRKLYITILPDNTFYLQI